MQVQPCLGFVFGLYGCIGISALFDVFLLDLLRKSMERDFEVANGREEVEA